MTEQILDAKRVLQLVWRHRPIALAFLIAALVASSLFVLVRRPSYTASALILLPGSNGATGAVTGNDMSTDSQIATSAAVLGQVGNKLLPGIPLPTLQEMVRARGVATNVLKISALGTTGSAAENLANSVARTLVKFVTANGTATNASGLVALQAESAQLTRQIANINSEETSLSHRIATEGASSTKGQQDSALLGSLNAQQSQASLQLDSINSEIALAQLGSGAANAGTEVIQHATVATKPSIVGSLLAILVSMLAGLVISTVIIVLIYRGDRRLWRRDELAEAIGSPVVLSLSAPRHSQPSSWAAYLESYRSSASARWRLQKTLRDLEVLPGEQTIALVVSVSGDMESVLAGPQIALCARELGYPVAWSAVGTAVQVADLRAAVGKTTRIGKTFGPGLDMRGEPRFSGLTVVSVIVDPLRPEFKGIHGRFTLLAVAAGSATTEELSRVAISVADRGNTIDGLIAVNPDPDDSSTGFIPAHPARGARSKPSEGCRPVTLDLDAISEPFSQVGDVAPQARTFPGSLLNLRHIVSEIRRRRRLLVVAALVGAAIGASFHLVVPRTFVATTTLYLADAPGSDDAVSMGDDLALLNNVAVASKAIEILREPSLNPTRFLGKSPGAALSDNVLMISMSGPSYSEAVRRVDAVANAYLKFRADQFNAQDEAIAAGLTRQIQSLQGQAHQLEQVIGDPSTGSALLAQDIAQHSQDETTISSLEQTVSQDRLNTTSTVQASRILTHGTAVYHSALKLWLVDAFTGLTVGLAIAIGLALFQALISNKVRYREEVALLVGATVEVSSERLPKARFGGTKTSPQTVPAQLHPVARYIAHQVVDTNRHSLLVVTIDDNELAALSMIGAATALATHGCRVVLSDLAAHRPLEAIFGSTEKPTRRIKLGTRASATLFVPPRDLGPEDDRTAVELSPDRWQKADVVLALATVEPSRGAWHFRSWDQAVIAVRAGRTTPQRLVGTAQLLRSSGIAVVATILFDADPEDESIGLAEVGNHWRRLPSEGRVLSVEPVR